MNWKSGRAPQPLVITWQGKAIREPLGARVILQRVDLTSGEFPMGIAEFERHTEQGTMIERVVAGIVLSCNCIVSSPGALSGCCDYFDRMGNACPALLHESDRVPPCSATTWCCGRRVCRQHLRVDGAGRPCCPDHDTWLKRLF